jgi:hypothetical protein
MHSDQSLSIAVHSDRSLFSNSDSAQWSMRVNSD